MTTYSNPRMEAMIDNWPMGGTRRGRAVFTIEQTPRGERAVRVTCDRGKFSAPKKLTYAVTARILDGDDGKTYIGETTIYGHVSIMQGGMQFQAETIHIDDPRWEPMMLMLGAAPALIAAHRAAHGRLHRRLG